MDGRCQCGKIKFTTPTASPLHLYVCHCTECRHQSSSLFGLTAIFPKFEIDEPSPGAISVYKRSKASGGYMSCYFCANCGSRLIHVPDNSDTLSVKGGCLEGKLDWDNATHIWVKEAIVKIPEHCERFDGEPKGGSFGGDEGKT